MNRLNWYFIDEGKSSVRSDFSYNCDNSTWLSASRQTEICWFWSVSAASELWALTLFWLFFCAVVSPKSASSSAETLQLGETRKLQMLCYYLLHASALRPWNKREVLCSQKKKRNNDTLSFKFYWLHFGRFYQYCDVSLTTTIGSSVYFKDIRHSPLTHSILCCTCLSALHTPLGKLSSACLELLKPVHMSVSNYLCLAVT